MKRSIAILIIAMSSTLGYVAVDWLTTQKSSLRVARIEQQWLATNGHPSAYGDLHRAIREGNGSTYPMGYRTRELEKAKQTTTLRASQQELLDWVERGPGNVGGRTRSIVVLPQDPSQSTWLAGSVGGGIWKTTNRGATWVSKTDDFPSLAITTMALSEAAPNVIYAGTGESFVSMSGIGGSGIFKSLDAGESWTQLSSTLHEDFNSINRIIVSPDDPDLLLVCSERSRPFFNTDETSFILRSLNGGNTWTRVFQRSNAIQQLIANPEDFDIQYATVNSVGVYKSVDGGQTWSWGSKGLTTSGRVELAISPIDTDVVWASAEEGSPEQWWLPGLYVTDNGGEQWTLLQEEEGSSLGNNFDFLVQGWYNNSIMAHPFDVQSVYVGGVSMFKFSQTDDTLGLSALEKSFEWIENETSFSTLVSFQGETGTGLSFNEDLADSLKVSIEVRFGPGVSQMAHRFTVGGKGGGVLDSDYAYQDYVSVPFEVWDITSQPERQLMATFRDQQEDGEYTLIEANTEGDGSSQSREYITVNMLDYNDSLPSVDIAQSGGHLFNQHSLLWLALSPGLVWDPENLPEETVTIRVSEDRLIVYKSSKVIADGNEAFLSSTGGQHLNGNYVVHVDHHHLQAIDVSQEDGTFRILDANDGGIFYSGKNSDPGAAQGDWTSASNGYNTSQFYGADKHPSAFQFLGGLQDNDSRISSDGEVAGKSTAYTVWLEGDGFEAFWHSFDEDRFIVSSQWGGYARRINGQFEVATNGLPGLSPFLSRIGASKTRPDVLFCLSYDGVYRSQDFGGWWEPSTMDVGWAVHGALGEVEVSLADPDIVWAGSFLGDTAVFQVSTDNGLTFSDVEAYTMDMGLSSGMATHPNERHTAYLLFSGSGAPKVLRTQDLGDSWEDISGFEGNSSNRGFPDVAVYDLFVFPQEPDRIWAGTDIGLVESLDNGASWALADNGLPNVGIWEIKQAGTELVLATHGRGIWSVTMDDLPQPLIAPSILASGLSPRGTLVVPSMFGAAFDSTEIFVNDSILETLKPTPAGEVLLEFPEFGHDGTVNLKMRAYKDGQSVNTHDVRVETYVVNAPAPSFKTDFNALDNSAFYGDGFRVARPTGFSDGALHSDHPYRDQNNHLYFLRTPVIVREEESIFSYEDIAIVEPSGPDAVFGDNDFWDYVIVEATRDGLHWTPLMDGYDASFDEEWESAFNFDEDPTDSMFVTHRVNIKDKFEVGDTLLFRFRLFADQSLNGYGWVVDNLAIQSEFTPLNTASNPSPPDFKVFPNPIGDRVIRGYVYSANTKSVDFELRDLTGRLMETGTLELPQSGGNDFEINVERHLQRGVYLLTLALKSGSRSLRIVFK